MAKRYLDTLTSEERKKHPMEQGLLGYFPDALAYVALVSREADAKHNGENSDGPFWNRDTSGDEADALTRHLSCAGEIDLDSGLRRSGEVAWRALALLQKELESAYNLDLPPSAYSPTQEVELSLSIGGETQRDQRSEPVEAARSAHALHAPWYNCRCGICTEARSAKIVGKLLRNHRKQMAEQDRRAIEGAAERARLIYRCPHCKQPEGSEHSPLCPFGPTFTSRPNYVSPSEVAPINAPPDRPRYEGWPTRRCTNCGEREGQPHSRVDCSYREP